MSVIKKPPGARGPRWKIVLALVGGVVAAVVVGWLASSTPIVAAAAAVGVATVGVLVQVMTWIDGGPGGGVSPPSPH